MKAFHKYFGTIFFQSRDHQGPFWCRKSIRKAGVRWWHNDDKWKELMRVRVSPRMFWLTAQRVASLRPAGFDRRPRCTNSNCLQISTSLNFPIHLWPLSQCPFINLGEGHLGDDGQHDLLPLRWIRVLLVLIQPSLMKTIMVNHDSVFWDCSHIMSAKFGLLCKPSPPLPPLQRLTWYVNNWTAPSP